MKKYRTESLFLPTWVYCMVGLMNGKDMTKISREYEITYSAITKTVMRLEEVGWIKKKKKGRKLIFDFTETGNRVAKSCCTLAENLKIVCVKENGVR